MTTRCTAPLPAVPKDRWTFVLLAFDGNTDDPDNPPVRYAGITATTAPEAELRVLAVLGRHYEHDLRNWEAEALNVQDATWTVRVTFRPPR